MFENNNKEVINKLIKRSLDLNKRRNIFVILAIILTTFMISSIFSIGFSFAKNYKIMILRTQSSTANVSLNNPTDKQVSDMKSLECIKNVGVQIKIGNINSKELADKNLFINMEYNDETVWEKQITPAISEINGNYPTKENEVMLSMLALELLGIEEPSIGMKINLNFNMNGEEKYKEFILSGYFKDYGLFSDTGRIMISNGFVDNNGFSAENSGKAYITIDEKDSYMLNDEIEISQSQEFNYNFDTSDEASDTSSMMIVVVSMISMFIVLSGYLLIYNVLYIAVIKDINFYGLLKTIGTSPKQIKKIVIGQALYLSYRGILIGVILSICVSFFAIPTILDIFSSGMNGAEMPSEISFNPLIFIGAILFSLLTTLLSCIKPAKIASSISPIEAIKLTGVKEKNAKQTKNSMNGGKLHKMAFNNVFRDKKRAVVVFLSLFMGIITFLSVNTFTSSLSLDNYLDKYIPYDFKLSSNNFDSQIFDSNFFGKLDDINGIKNIEKVYIEEVNIDYKENIFKPYIEGHFDYHDRNDKTEIETYIEDIKNNGVEYSTYILAIDTKTIEEINTNSNNKIDIEAFKRGDTAIIDISNLEKIYQSSIEKEIGNLFSIIDSNTALKKAYKLEVIKDEGLPVISSEKLGVPIIYISSEAINDLNKSPIICSVSVDVEEKNEPAIKDKIKDMVGSNSVVNLSARSDEAESFKYFIKMMNIMGGGIGFILILIGILNFVNVMVTGVNSRMKELAVMESIGMTKKQIKKMLTYEGGYYAIISIVLMGTVGTPIIYIISKLSREIADYAKFVFPGVQLIIIIVVILIICLITPKIVFSSVSKKCVTERLRDTEN